MPGIQLSGLASGLDTASIIAQLMSIERQPRTRIEYRQAAEQARRDGLSDVETKLKSLKLAATDLRSIGTWADTQSATSSDTSKIDVRRTGGAGPGGYDIAVTSLASSTQRTYTYAPPADGTTLTFTVKDADGNDVATSIEIAAGASLDDTVSTINTSVGSPVYAVNVSGKLVLASRATGENARFTMQDSAGGTLTQVSERLGQNAQLTVDGQAYESQSNTVSDVVPGLELTLKGTTSGVQLNVSAPGPDRALLTSKMKAFVDAYNAVVDSVRAKVGEKPVVNPSSASDAKKGALYGDAGLNGILSQLRRGISDLVPGNASTLDQLSELGVSTGGASGTINADSVAGKLTFDSDKLAAALDKDPLAVRRFLGGIAGTDGIAQRFENILSPVAGTGGTLDRRISSQNSVLSSIARDLADFDERLSRKEDALNKQYTALETALAQAQSRASNLAGLPTG
jgi:flagellar hook-associated protein 2